MTAGEASGSVGLDRVVEGAYCVGCGACAALEGSPFDIVWDEYGRYQAKRNSASRTSRAESQLVSVCPFGAGLDETAIGRERYGGARTHDDRIGYFEAAYAGYVAEGDFRRDGSSGGFTSWLMCEFLQRGMIDAVIHVRSSGPAQGKVPLFRMTVSRSDEEIRSGARSRYYPVEMSQVLREVQRVPGRYALVGLPCFVKALRLLARADSRIRERVVYCVGLVCGHMKSARFADMLAWQLGVAPGELAAIDFRSKARGLPARRYVVEVKGNRGLDASPVYREWSELFGTNWGQGLFKYHACDYCDDVLAETADVSVGDAWIPEFKEDREGTNLVVVRHRGVMDLIEEARRSGRLHLDYLSPEQVARSQDAGLRHRREGLAYRLYLKDQKGVWRPGKRVEACASHLGKRQKEIQQCRMELVTLSHFAFREAVATKSFEVFSELLGPAIREYSRLYAPPLWRQVASLMRRNLRRMTRLITMQHKQRIDGSA